MGSNALTLERYSTTDTFQAQIILIFLSALKTYTGISVAIVVDFFKYCLFFYYAHVCHLLYLHRLNMLDCTTLVDSGEYVVFVDDTKQHLESKDVKDVIGLCNNKSGNYQHLPIR